MKSLCKALPAKIPLFEKDNAQRGLLRTGMGRPMCDGITSGQTEPWIDGVTSFEKSESYSQSLDDRLIPKV